MNNLKDELIEMIEIFDYYKISEEKQREIINNGVEFTFDVWNQESKKLSCLEFGRFIKFCKSVDSEFDVDRLVTNLNNYDNGEYGSLLSLFTKVDQKEKSKTLIR